MTRPDLSTKLAASLGDELLSIRVDKSIPVPAYAQIAGELRHLLQRGASPGDLELPSERLLCKAYGVSRMTLRQALDILERDGLIQRKRGRGTFASIPRPDQPAGNLSDQMSARGTAGFTKLLSFRVGRPTPPARAFFGLGEDAEVFQIRRLRIADRIPLAVESVQVHRAVCPSLNQFDLVHESFSRILEEHYGLVLAECVEEISALRPNRTQRKLLEAPASAAILVVRRRTRTAAGVPAEFAITAYRGDLYTAVVRSAGSRQLSDKWAPFGTLGLNIDSSGLGATEWKGVEDV